MRDVTSQEYQALLNSTQLIEQDQFGPKVLLTDDRRIVKLFRRKHFFSKALIFPPARRFTDNAQQLQKLGIDTITVEDYGRCSDPPRELVWYPYLEGETLRALCKKNETQLSSLIEDLGGFIALLHQRGVLFRSLHWNNVLVQPSGRFALIDILDMRIQRRPLNFFQRRRNFSHLLCRHPQDLQIYQANTDVFWKGYASQAELTRQQLKSLSQRDYLLRK